MGRPCISPLFYLDSAVAGAISLILRFRTSLFSSIALSCLIFFLFVLSAISGFFILNPIPAIQSTVKATYIEDGEVKDHRIDLDTLDVGKFRIATKNFRGSLQLIFEMKDRWADANFLMLRKGIDHRFKTKTINNLKISIPSGSTFETTSSPMDSSQDLSREIFPLPKRSNQELTLWIENIDADEGDAQLILDEIGIYKKNPNRFPSLDVNKLKMAAKVLKATIGFCGILLLATLERRKAKVFGTLFIFALGLATFASTIFVKFSPEWSRDLKCTFASDTLHSGLSHNHTFNYGLYIATSILEGKGPLLHGAPTWYKMPGYGFILALVGGQASYLIEDLLSFAVKGVFLQIICFISGLAFLFWAAIRILPPITAAMATIGILFLPSWMIFRLNIEGIMPAVALFCLGGSCLFLDQYNKNKSVCFPLPYHFIFHAGFALWFFLRTDILPAWAIVSMVLYCRKLYTCKYLAIPLFLFLLIGIPWALFKKDFTGVFNMTTESVGASFMGGLWEVPNKFIWTNSDASFLEWVDSVGLKCLVGPTGMRLPTKAISDFATKESLLFLCTYPIYALSLIWHKFMEFVNYDGMSFPLILLLSVPTIALLIHYKRMQTLLFGWMIFFNMPIFCVFFSDSWRFVAPIFICLVFMGCSLLFDKDFYFYAFQKKKITLAILILFFGIFTFGKNFDEFLIRQDQWRYWAPFLNPANSTFNVETPG